MGVAGALSTLSVLTTTPALLVLALVLASAPAHRAARDSRRGRDAASSVASGEPLAS